MTFPSAENAVSEFKTPPTKLMKEQSLEIKSINETRISVT